MAPLELKREEHDGGFTRCDSQLSKCEDAGLGGAAPHRVLFHPQASRFGESPEQPSRKSSSETSRYALISSLMNWRRRHCLEFRKRRSVTLHFCRSRLNM